MKKKIILALIATTFIMFVLALNSYMRQGNIYYNEKSDYTINPVVDISSMIINDEENNIIIPYYEKNSSIKITVNNEVSFPLEYEDNDSLNIGDEIFDTTYNDIEYIKENISFFGIDTKEENLLFESEEINNQIWYRVEYEVKEGEDFYLEFEDGESSIYLSKYLNYVTIQNGYIYNVEFKITPYLEGEISELGWINDFMLDFHTNTKPLDMGNVLLILSGIFACLTVLYVFKFSGNTKIPKSLNASKKKGSKAILKDSEEVEEYFFDDSIDEVETQEESLNEASEEQDEEIKDFSENKELEHVYEIIEEDKPEEEELEEEEEFSFNENIEEENSLSEASEEQDEEIKDFSEDKELEHVYEIIDEDKPEEEELEEEEFSFGEIIEDKIKDFSEETKEDEK